MTHWGCQSLVQAMFRLSQKSSVSSPNSSRPGPAASPPSQAWKGWKCLFFSAPSPHSSVPTQTVKGCRGGLPAQSSDEPSFLSATSSILSGLDDSARQRRFSPAVGSLREKHPLKKQVPTLKGQGEMWNIWRHVGWFGQDTLKRCTLYFHCVGETLMKERYVIQSKSVLISVYSL